MLIAFVFAFASPYVSFAQVSPTQFADNVPPTITLPVSPVIAEASGPQGSVVNFNAIATDNTGKNIGAQCIPPSGSTFGLGDTTVECTAVDGAGNENQDSFTVRVQDTIPPTTALETSRVSWMGQLDNQGNTISDDIGFAFSGSDIVGVKGFECRIDENNWQPSTVNYQIGNKNGCYYTNLGQGQHTFQVRAIDTSGNKDQSPEVFSWTIMPLKDALVNLREYTAALGLPSSFEGGLLNSLDNAIGNIQVNERYDKLICEYIDSFNYGFSTVSVLDFVTQDAMGFIDDSTGAIRDRTGCNPPIVGLVSETVVDEGTKNVILDGSNSFDSKDGKNLIYAWTQLSGPKVNFINGDKSKSSFNAPLIDGTNNQTITLRLTVTDRNDLSTDKTSGITIRNIVPVSSPPVAESQSVTATSGSPTDITLKATAPDGKALTYAIVSAPKSGTITDLNKDTGSLVYTPGDGFTGQDRFTFKASDGTTDSNTAPVTVTVSQVVSPPVAESQSVTATSGSPTDITLKATAPDGKALTYAIVSAPKSGTITDLNKDTGSLVYTPGDGFTGQDRFTFKASDGTTDSNTAPVTVTVSQVVSPPVAESQSVTATSGSPTDITLKATAPDGKALTYAIVSAPKSGTITDLNKDTGSLVYTPGDGFTGQDRFTFKASDGTTDSNTAPVTVTVSQVVSPPVAESQSVTATSGSPTDITLKATDPDGNALTYAIVSAPKSGTITDLNKDTGSLVYTPGDGFTGQDRFTFKASDGTTDSNTAPVTVTVSQVASPPVAESQSVTATSGSPTDITLKATAPDGKALTYAIVSAPKSGTITDLNKDTGSLVYTPGDGFTGQDRFTFKASDGTTDSNTAPVTVTVSQVVSPPVAESQSVTATSGSPTDITLKATAPDGKALTYAIVSAPKSGTITDLNKDTGSLVYTPGDGFTGQDRFTFKASDGTTDSNTAPVTVKAPTDENQVTVKAPTDENQVTVKAPTDENQVTVKAPTDENQVTVKAPTDENQVTVKAPTDENQVTVKAPTDKNQDANVGKKSDNPKEIPGQDPTNTNSLISPDLSRDNG